MATYARAVTGATIAICDLAAERQLGPVDIPALFSGEDGGGFDIIVVSIDSSFDHLKCWAMAEMARIRLPDALIACRGNHASARPLDYVAEDSVFDVCIVGEGERPLVEIIESVYGGVPLRHTTLGPWPVDDLDGLPQSDWSLLARYKPIARQMASQARLSLSRGKRDRAWRPFSVARAISELESLHDFLDLRGWTVCFDDAVFGHRERWRREFLEALASRGLPVDGFWLRIRAELVADEDLRLFGAANCGLGFGLHSGTPSVPANARSAHKPSDALLRVEDIVDQARAHNVPWRADVICGYPGETPETLKQSAAHLQRLFLGRPATTGFLSVEPFRLYPGSPVNTDRGHYERIYGTRFHHTQWWKDEDSAFLSAWVDPSDELTYLQREEAQHRLLSPILAQLEDKFVYRGKASEHYRRAIRDQMANAAPQNRLPSLERYYAWQGYLGRGAAARRQRRGDRVLAGVVAELRLRRLGTVCSVGGIVETGPIARAIANVPRERFVPLDAIADSVQDAPVPLDTSGAATVSAMHAYALSFSRLGLTAGDRVLDLGAGAGYGCALLRQLVGEGGEVVGLEIDPALVELANAELEPDTRCHVADGLDPASWPANVASFGKITVGFAVDSIPPSWAEVLVDGTVIVLPLQDPDGVLKMTRLRLRAGEFSTERFEVVSFVRSRRVEEIGASPEAAESSCKPRR